MLTSNDPAGSAIHMTRALRRAGHECRLVTTEIRYNFLFPKDLHVPWLNDFSALEEALTTADVFHFHMTFDENIRVGPFLPRDFLRDQLIVHHHHGEPPFRADPRPFREKERGRAALVSTPDLLKLHPEATWIPNPVPLDDPRLQPVAKRNPRVRVGHSPTRVELKNTDDFIAATERLDLERVIIQNTAWEQCLETKRGCDLFFDHMQGYYGMSSLEALAQGVPTIAGLDDWNIDHLKDFTGADDLPWVIARDRAALRAAIRSLAHDPAARAAIGAASRRWMERYWTEESIGGRLAAWYEAQRQPSIRQSVDPSISRTRRT